MINAFLGTSVPKKLFITELYTTFFTIKATESPTFRLLLRKQYFVHTVECMLKVELCFELFTFFAAGCRKRCMQHVAKVVIFVTRCGYNYCIITILGLYNSSKDFNLEKALGVKSRMLYQQL